MKKTTQNSDIKTKISRMFPLGMLAGFAIPALLNSCFYSPAALTPKFTSPPQKNYYIDNSIGSDSNYGSQSQPWKTIQKCLDLVQPGGTCQIVNGTYNETLILKTTGMDSAPITLQCETPLDCIINSGAARTLITNGPISYYVIDGFRFISSITNTGSDPNLSSVNFAYNYWGDGDKFERGNDGFILRNCYVEGAVYFYGSDNLVENCELNGRGVVSNGLTERSQPSENNVFRNNIIHDYTVRAGWSLQMTNNTLWEGNTIYNIAPNGGGAGINCDGAGYAVYGCNIKNNLFYNNGASSAIAMENGFDSVLENNIIHDGVEGINVINYNIENGSDPFSADKDYKELMTNTIIKNNVIYNINDNGIICRAVRGNQVYNNTFYNIKTSQGYFGAIGLASYTQIGCPDWIVRNNIISQSPKAFYIYGIQPETIDNNFYDLFSASIEPDGLQTFVQWQALGYDVNSRTGNPLFVNAKAGDFRLQPNSPACGYGAFPCR